MIRIEDSDPREGDPIGGAWDALDDGDPEEALRILEGVEADAGERWVAETIARIDIRDLSAAERALRRAYDLLGDDDPGVLWATGELRLHIWQVDEARAVYERLDRIERTGTVLERIALCHELAGNFSEADDILAEAYRLDPENGPCPARLTVEEFEGIVREAVGELPEEFQDAFETMAVVIDPVPDPDLAAGEEVDTPPDLLGLFIGRSMMERTLDDSGELPPTIYLFQRNLERHCRTKEELREEIRITLYHELGHSLGLDEEGLENLGLA